MGVIVSFINRKGGVGKTTITVNLGGYLAKTLEKKVLIIDLDPQASASSWLMTQDRYLKYIVESPEKPLNTSYQIFRDALFNEKMFDKNIGIQKGVVKNDREEVLIPKLDLLPASAKLDNLEREIVNYNDLKLAILLEAFIEHKIIEDYEYILIDCPPNMGIATQNALFSSDVFIIPIIADPLSFQGFPELINSAREALEIASKRREDHRNPFCGGLIISHDRDTISCRETIENIRSLLTIFRADGRLNKETDLFISKISYRTAIPDVQAIGTILATAKKKSISKTEFETLAYEFNNKFKDLIN